jgi:formylglycine-generating enzyme required for sulfatase activity
MKPQIGLAPLGPDPDSGLWEFWHVESGKKPERDEKLGKLSIRGETGMVLVLLPGGTFLMGAQSGVRDAPNYSRLAQMEEGPVHQVTLSAFFLSKYEMTQGQWLRIMDGNPSLWNEEERIGWSGANALMHPVETVNWDDCREALARVGLVLPTEAQWEYGARAGTDTPWWTGLEVESLEGAANLADVRYVSAFPGARFSEEWLDDGYGMHAPVGLFRPNGFGLHDVAGNVWEWCRDWYGGYEIEVSDEEGLRAVQVQEGPRYRVYRGCGFSDTASFARSAFRVSHTPGLRSSDLGVRPAWVRR